MIMKEKTSSRKNDFIIITIMINLLDNLQIKGIAKIHN
jgi:hypothetical protein